MANIEGIRKKYAICLDEATKWLNRNGYAVFPKSLVVKAEKNAEGTVVITTPQPIHLKNWPERGKNARKKLDILVDIKETVSLKEGVCLKSNARVTYFRMDGGKALAIESLHYDCDIPPTVQHPICHAQNNRRYVEPLVESFSATIDAEALERRCQTVRVPTAFINLPGLFVILAADHLSSNHWPEFMKTCRKYFNNVPRLPEHRLIDQEIPGERLAAWAWYTRDY